MSDDIKALENRVRVLETTLTISLGILASHLPECEDELEYLIAKWDNVIESGKIYESQEGIAQDLIGLYDDEEEEYAKH